MFAAATDDFDDLLGKVATHTAEVIDCYCGVLLVTEDGAALQSAALHGRDARVCAQLSLLARDPVPLATSPILAHALAGDAIVELPGLDPATLALHVPAPGDRHALEALPLRQIVLVPLRAHGKALGLLMLARHGVTTPLLDPHDRELARSLADLAALAVSNARLLANQERVNQQLRRSSELARSFAGAISDPQRLYDAIAKSMVENRSDLALMRLVSPDLEWLETTGAVVYHDPVLEAEARQVILGERLRVDEWIARSAVVDAMPKHIGPVATETLIAAYPPRFRALFEKLRPTALRIVPLVSHAGVVGIVGLFRSGAAFSETESALHLRIAAHAAEAIANARLLEVGSRELVARRRIVGHLRVLSELSRQFSAATEDLDLLLDTLASRLMEVVGDGCMVRLLTEDGLAFETIDRSAHPNEEMARPLRQAVMAGPQPISEGLMGIVASTGESLLIPKVTDEHMAKFTPEARAVARKAGVQSWLGCPLTARGKVVGVITLYRLRANQPYGTEDRRLVEDIAVHAGLAVSNALLLASRKRELLERQRLSERVHAVLGLAREFSATSDFPTLLELITKRVGELVGDLCILRMVTPDGTAFEPGACCFHPDPAVRAHAEALVATTPLTVGRGVAGGVAATGTSFMATMPAGQMVTVVHPKFEDFVRSYDLCSMIAVPVLLDGRVTGVLSVSRGEGRPAYTADDLASVEDLAAHASLAITNSRLLAAAKSELVERMKTEDVLRRGFLEAAPDAVLIVDDAQRITLVNSRAEVLFGYSRTELLEASLSDLVPGAATADATELVGRHKDGRTFAVELTTSPIATPAGLLMATAVRDVTERRREFEERNRRMQEANRLKSEFLANMSHELRTPLNAIIGFTSLIHAGKAGPVSEIHKEYLGDILSSSRHLLQLINDVLDLSKVESGKLELNVELIDLAKLAGEVQNIVRGLLAEHRVKLHLAIAADIGRVELDPRLIKQVLYNYLSNAIKFTPEGGRVELAIAPIDADHIRIDVTDSGVGIAEHDLMRLFTEFQQLGGDLVRRAKGTGLGLALTKRIVEAQGGTVSVRSKLGSGSTFSATLPRSVPAVAA